MSSDPPDTNNVVGVHYRVGKKIGEGSFGVIFEGTDLLNSTTVAIKFEPRRAESPQLRDECRSYRILVDCPGIPQIYHFGPEGLHNILVIDLLGPSLEDLFDMCGRKFSTKTVCMAARQMISRAQTIHEKNLIYRGVKPDDFLIGRSGTKGANGVFGFCADNVQMVNQNLPPVIHVVDFGMAKHYRDPKTKQHIPYRERPGRRLQVGATARYMSINAHLGREQSRRDDLESLGYVFMYFLRGGLPWQGLRAATNKQKHEKIGEKKQVTSIRELCEGFPEEFAIYLNYVRKLGFEETPDYDFLRALIAKVLRNTNEVDDGVFDWDLLNGGKGWEVPMPSDRHHDSGHEDDIDLLEVEVPSSAPAPQDAFEYDEVCGPAFVNFAKPPSPTPSMHPRMDEAPVPPVTVPHATAPSPHSPQLPSILEPSTGEHSETVTTTKVRPMIRRWLKKWAEWSSVNHSGHPFTGTMASSRCPQVHLAPSADYFEGIRQYAPLPPPQEYVPVTLKYLTRRHRSNFEQQSNDPSPPSRSCAATVPESKTVTSQAHPGRITVKFSLPAWFICFRPCGVDEVD